MRLAGRRARCRALGTAAAAASARQRLREEPAVHAADVRAGGAGRARSRHCAGAGRGSSRSCSSISAPTSDCSRCSWRRSRDGRARIVAIEPEPGNFERLRFNVAANPGLPIEPGARGARRPARARSLIEVDHRDRGGTRAAPGDRRRCPMRVPRRPLLGDLRERAIERIDAIKIDVEAPRTRCWRRSFAMRRRTLWPALILIVGAAACGRWIVRRSIARLRRGPATRRTSCRQCRRLKIRLVRDPFRRQ